MAPFSIRQTASACQRSQSSICTTRDGSTRFKVHTQIPYEVMSGYFIWECILVLTIHHLLAENVRFIYLHCSYIICRHQLIHRQNHRQKFSPGITEICSCFSLLQWLNPFNSSLCWLNSHAKTERI